MIFRSSKLFGPALLLLLATAVTAAQEPSLSDRIMARVRSHVEAGLDAAGLKGEIVSISLPAAADNLPADAQLWPIRNFIPGKAAGRHIIPLKVTSPGSRSTKINVTVATVAIVNGWTTSYAVKRGAPLDAAQFSRKSIRVTGRETDYIQEDVLPDGYQLASTIKPGQLLKHHHIELVPDVMSGDEVTIYFKYNTITLVSTGKARRKGRIGDTIPVVVGATGKRFNGLLTAPGVVVVE